MTITIIGHGYVGIVAACVFADFGNTVYVIGHTPAKLERLKSGDPLIYEPGLAEMLQRNNTAGRLIFTTEYAQALKESSIVFICVGTPPTPGTGEADLTTVFKVAEEIGKNLDTNKFTLVSCKSTVPVGTNMKVKEIISSVIARNEVTKQSQSNEILNQVQDDRNVFSVASCPEFLREGTGIHDTLNPDRIVIGADDQRAINLLLELHKPFPGERVVTNIPSAELIKYASNSLLATKLSFANMIALFAESLGADAPQVLRAVGMDNRIGPKNLDVSIGYGGACFPKDVQALIATGYQYKVDVSLMEAVENVNELSWKNYVDKVKKNVPIKLSTQHLALSTPCIAVWGLAFKANTDDIRFAPAVKIVEQLAKDGYKVRVYDPAAMTNVKKQLGDSLEYFEKMYDVVDGADALCVLTEWNEFRQADLGKIKSLLKKPLIIDGRNLYDPSKMKELGFDYIGTGR
jgi:UDPglucose 6-dehydrogenase